MSEVALTREHEPIETRFLDRAHKARSSADGFGALGTCWTTAGQRSFRAAKLRAEVVVEETIEIRTAERVTYEELRENPQRIFERARHAPVVVYKGNVKRMTISYPIPEEAGSQGREVR